MAINSSPSRCVHVNFHFNLFVLCHLPETSTAIPNCFSVDTQYCPCHRGRYLQFLTCITITWGLGSLQNTEMTQICCFCWAPKAKRFSASGALPPDPLTRGSAPGTHWGLCPQTPIISLRFVRSPCVSTPHFLTWRLPYVR